MARTKQASAQTTASAVDTAPTESINYDAAVTEGKAIVAKIEEAERGQLRLGELADMVETRYSDRTLAKFAVDLGVAKCTLDRYRTVYRAWKDILAPGAKIPPYTVLRELATHPDRAEIIEKDPAITKREACQLVRREKATAEEDQQEKQESGWLKQNRKWFKDLVTQASEVSRIATTVDLDACTTKQLEDLRDAIEPNLLRQVRSAGLLLRETADRLAEICELDENYDPIPGEADVEVEPSAIPAEPSAIPAEQAFAVAAE
jgi:hypothetical protein